jgi:hypothetical protein
MCDGDIGHYYSSIESHKIAYHFVPFAKEKGEESGDDTFV